MPALRIGLPAGARDPRSQPRRATRAGALAGAALALSLLAACGQTGPLYLPDDEGATVITRPGPAASPAPAPAPQPATPPGAATPGTATPGTPPPRRDATRPGT